jgi:dCTP deaminase
MSTSVLSDKQILQEMKNGNIWISPFQQNNLSNTSYDVTLGPNYYRCSKNPQELLLPWDEESVEKYWGDPQYAMTIMNEGMSQRYKLPIDTQFILLEPGELILGHTNEFIGGIHHIVCMMKAKSSMGRVGISVCKDACLGNIGYVNRWTMEIQNSSKSTIPLVVGSRIAQIVFLYSGSPSKSYEKKGAYQDSYESVEDLMKNWSVYEMIPKYKI